MRRTSRIAHILALGAIGSFAACACTENIEQGEYCEELTGPTAQAMAPGALVAPEAAMLLEASLRQDAATAESA